MLSRASTWEAFRDVGGRNDRGWGGGGTLVAVSTTVGSLAGAGGLLWSR